MDKIKEAVKHVNEGREYLFVSIGDDWYSKFKVSGTRHLCGFQHKWIPLADQLPPAEWSILCRANEATEDQAAEIVRGYSSYFTATEYETHYENYAGRYNFLTAKESLESLLTSHGLEMDGTLILQKL